MSTALSELPKTPKIDMRSLPALAKQQINHAKLPVNYVAARLALRECILVDECKDIADKHSALAHYARQIKDDSLRYYAERIHLRAMVRMGDILKKLNLYTDQRRAGKKAGLTFSQTNMVVDMAQLPDILRDDYIENMPPAKPRKMADAGYLLRHGRERQPAPNHPPSNKNFRKNPYRAAKSMLAALKTSIQHWTPNVCAGHAGELPEATRWLRNMSADETKRLKPLVKELSKWLKEFEKGLNDA